MTPLERIEKKLAELKALAYPDKLERLDFYSWIGSRAIVVTDEVLPQLIRALECAVTKISRVASSQAQDADGWKTHLEKIAQALCGEEK